MEPNLKINIENLDNDSQIVKFNGEFDKAGHTEIRETLDTSVKSFEGKNLIFDFTNLKFINSEGIGYLMEIHAHLVKKDKKLVIVGLNNHVEDVFKTIGINEIISIYPNLNSFLEK